MTPSAATARDRAGNGRRRPSRLPGILLAALVLAAPGAASEGTLAVGGRVLGAAGQGLAGAVVELLAEGRAAAAESAEAPPAARAVTGADGAFRLLAPAPGLWRVRVTAGASPPLEHPLHPLLADAQLAPLLLGSPRDPATPPPGGWRMPAPVAAPGRPAAAAVAPGRVMDARTGAPVPGALVWPPGEPGALVRTAADGRFRAELPAGARTLRVAAPGYLVADREVAPGDAAGEVRLEPGATLAGRVVDRAGRPVADAGLRMAFGARPLPGLETFSRTDGGFLLSGVPPDRAGELRAALDAGGRRLAARQPLAALRPREKRAGLRLVLAASPKLSGRVVAPEGRPVAGARLRLVAEPPASGTPHALPETPPAAEAHSLADGRFELLDAGTGRFRLELASEGYLPLARPGIELRAAGGDVDLGDLVLQASAALTGTVVEEGGGPVAAAAIQARGEGGPWRTESGADGWFTLAPLPPGARLEVAVRHRDFVPVVLEVEVSPAPLEVVLRPGATLSGRVVDAGGRGVGEAEVVASAEPEPAGAVPARQPERAAVEPDGRFTLHLPPGTVSVRASAPGYRDAELAGIEVAPGVAPSEVELVLHEAAVLTGTVRTADGSPLAGARVSVRSPDAGRGVLGTALVGAEGAFRVERLEPGPVEARAEHPRFRRAARTLDLSLGENRVELVLEQGLAVAGRVVDGAGRPLEGVAIEVREVPGAPPSHSAVSRADGAFRLTGLEPGRLVLTGRREGFAPARLELELGEEPLTGVEVRLERGGAVTGRLLGLPAADLGRVEVVAFRPGEPNRAGTLQPGGTYRIDGLLPGAWTVVASVAPGARQVRGEVRLADGEEVLDLDFGAGIRLGGRVRAGARPLAGALVALLGRAGQEVAQVRTGADGRFEITGLAAGAYRLRLSDPAGEPLQEQPLELTGDRDLSLDLTPGPSPG